MDVRRKSFRGYFWKSVIEKLFLINVRNRIMQISYIYNTFFLNTNKYRYTKHIGECLNTQNQTSVKYFGKVFEIK